MLEQILDTKQVLKRPFVAFILGFIYLIIAYFTAKLFFGDYISIAMLFIATLLIVPSFVYLIDDEEKKESEEGTRHFIKEHKEIFEIYGFTFLGMFFGYLIIGLLFDAELIFQYQNVFISANGMLDADLIKNFVAGSSVLDNIGNFISIFSANIQTILVFFVLSIFYGVGSVFLVNLNASIFASFIQGFIQQTSASNPILIMSIMLIHFVPEIFGFLLAAISGGVISKAIIVEEFGSPAFKNVLRDGFLILLIAIGIILLSSVLEVFVTGNLLRAIL